MVASLIIMAICGVGVGILSGLLGIGGGIIVIPLLRLVVGVDGLMTSGTSLFVILPTSLSGFIGRLRNGGVHVKIGVLIGLGGVLFSPIGSWLSQQVGGFWPMVAASIVIGYTGLNMVKNGLKYKPAAKDLSTSTAPEEEIAPTDEKIVHIDMDARHVVSALAVGAVAGFLSGFIGIGGGFIIIPMSMWLFGISFKEASGVSLLALCMLAVPGIITHGFYGHIDYLRGIALAAGSIPGALIGAKLVKKVPEKLLRVVFGVFNVGIAIMLILNELGIGF